MKSQEFNKFGKMDFRANVNIRENDAESQVHDDGHEPAAPNDNDELHIMVFLHAFCISISKV